MNDHMEIWTLAALTAFFIKGLCGFANTLVFNSILTFGNNNILVSPTELLLGYPTNLVIAVRERKSIDPKICIPLSILVLAGSIPGVFLLKNVDATMIKILFGIVVVLIGIEMLLRENTGRKDSKIKNGGTDPSAVKRSRSFRILLMLIGILSGILCGLYGIGALLGAYISRVTEDTKAFKGNICVVFFVENTFRIVLYALTGILTIPVLKQAFVLIPFMALGLFAGIKCSRIVPEKIAKKLVVILLIVSGIMLILQNTLL